MYKPIIARIDRETIIPLLRDLVKIPSISGEEQKLAEYVAEICSEMGLDTTIDRHGNMIAILRGKKPGPRIAFNSHLDTVGFGEGWTRDPLGAEIVSDRLYGRGSCDCKASIAAQIIAVKALIEADVELAGEIALTHVVEEEVQDANRKGTVRLLRDGFTADMAINGEATDMKVGLACGGMVEVAVKTIGKRAHGSNPAEGINAIEHMMRMIAAIQQLQPGHHPYTGPGSIVPGVIRGGERSSVVPDECHLKVARFIVPGETGEDFIRTVQQIITEQQAKDAHFQATTEMTYCSQPALIQEDEAIVQHMIHAFRTLDMPYQFGGTPQHDDADYLVNMGKIPTVIYGPGKIKVGHIPDEYVEISEVVTATRVYALTLYHALGGAK